MNIDHNVSKQTNISKSIIFFKVQYQYALMSINLSAKNLSHHPQSSASFSDSWHEDVFENTPYSIGRVRWPDEKKIGIPKSPPPKSKARVFSSLVHSTIQLIFFILIKNAIICFKH